MPGEAEGREWGRQALLIVPDVGAEGQPGAKRPALRVHVCPTSGGHRVTSAGHSSSRARSLGSEIKVTIEFSVPTPSLWRNSRKMVSVKVPWVLPEEGDAWGCIRHHRLMKPRALCCEVLGLQP